MNSRLFAYGTLQSAEVQVRLFGRVLNGIPATLPGYVLGKIEVEGEQYLVADEGNGEIAGTVYEVGPQDLVAADEYETNAYRRAEIVLSDGSRAWTYLRADV